MSEADLEPDPNGGPPSIAPNTLEPLRIAGEKMILPDDDVRYALRKTGGGLEGSFKFCLDDTGHIAHLAMLERTGVDAYDAKIARKLNAWVFRPVVVGGRPIAVCSAVTIIYRVN